MAKKNKKTVLTRKRFRKIPPGIYQLRKSSGLLIIFEDGTYAVGYTCIRKEKYRYARWREGKKIKEEYLGTV